MGFKQFSIEAGWFLEDIEFYRVHIPGIHSCFCEVSCIFDNGVLIVGVM